MAVIAFTSAAGSPGVSTSVVGLSLAWDRPCLVVEADPTGSTAILTGYMRQYAASGVASVFDVAVQLRNSGMVPNLWEVATPVPDTNVRLLSGVRSHTQARSMGEAWSRIATHLASLEAAGIDVLVDLGRIGLVSAPTALMNAADLVLLVSRSTLPAVVAANSFVPGLRGKLNADAGKFGMLLVGEGHPYKASEISKQLQIPVVAKLPSDPSSAEVFSLGSKPGSRFTRGPLYRSLPPAVAAIKQHMDAARTRLEV